MNPVPYQRRLDQIISSLNGRRPTLLLHACCAPCSSYVLEYLHSFFDITLFFYNPNLDTRREYDLRRDELIRLTRQMGLDLPVLAPEYDNAPYYEAVKGLEHLGEGSARCEACFRLRLKAAAEAAAEGGFDWFTTTLTISPLKNAALLNDLGTEAGAAAGVAFLPSDFKKKGGYLRSTQLSKEFGLYRQDYCGCAFSKTEARLRREEKHSDLFQK